MSQIEPDGASSFARKIAAVRNLPEGPRVIPAAVRAFVKDEGEPNPKLRVLSPEHFEKVRLLVHGFCNWAEVYLHEWAFAKPPTPAEVPVELAAARPVRRERRKALTACVAVAATVLVVVGVWLAARPRFPVEPPGGATAGGVEVAEGKVPAVSHGHVLGGPAEGDVRPDDRGVYRVSREFQVRAESQHDGFATVVICSPSGTRVVPPSDAPSQQFQLRRGPARCAVGVVVGPLKKGDGEEVVLVFLTDMPAARVAAAVFGTGPISPADIDARIARLSPALKAAGHTRLEKSRVTVAPAAVK